MKDRISRVILYFFIYAFLGWSFELIFNLVTTHQVIRNGLIGPWMPIYGFGMTGVLLIQKRVADHPLLLFSGAVLITSTLELLTGLALMSLFHRRWWDYSARPLNLYGYIDLFVSFTWGFMAFILARYLQPRVEKKLDRISPEFLRRMALVLALFLATDTALTFRKLFRALP